MAVKVIMSPLPLRVPDRIRAGCDKLFLQSQVLRRDLEERKVPSS